MIAILTDPGVGGVFLNWSIHYLAGHKYYYSADEKKLISITDNPLTQLNAHNFQPNQVSSIENFKKTLKNLLNHKSSDFNTIYFHNFIGATESYHLDTTNAVKELLPHTSKIILLSSTTDQALYQCKFETRVSFPMLFHDTDTELTNNHHEKFKKYIEHFFGSSKEIWDNLNLKDTWDIREFLALNIRPFKTVHMIDNMDLTHDHYPLNTIELWNRFDETVESLLEYLDIKINVDNFEKWKLIYQQWKKIHKDRLLFVWYFNTIIEYIIKGYSLDLTRFNLDICQEAAIQHQLIYSHNLNLKTWQLEKFTNTRQLHELLEPNIHSITKY